MSLHGLHSFMYRLKNDAALQQHFKERADAAFTEFELDEPEIRALREGDVATLYQMGVHPLLLVPYSRYAGIARPDYLTKLAPLKGTRVMKSRGG
jgi:hypothetical protein